MRLSRPVMAVTFSALLLSSCSLVRSVQPTTTTVDLNATADQVAAQLTAPTMNANIVSVSGNPSPLKILADMQELELQRQSALAAISGTATTSASPLDPNVISSTVVQNAPSIVSQAAPTIVQPSATLVQSPPTLVAVAQDLSSSASSSPVARTGDVSRVVGMVLQGQTAEVQSFYRARGNKPAWYGQSGWSSAALTAHQSLRNSLFDGLPPFRYGTIVNQALPTNGLPNDIAMADIALTGAMLKYMVELRDGMDVAKQKRNGTAVLRSALSSGDMTNAIERLRPKNAQYRALAAALRGGSLNDKQRGTILVNMERLRKWSHPHKNRYIQVNLPSQQLYGFKSGGNLDIRMPVVVGQLSRQTPILSDRITNLKFSPDWTVPRSIARKDIVPILRSKGASGVASMNLRARRGGKSVDLASVNWSKANPDSYTFYQPAGPTNALGGVRFSLTNGNGIYLHDTPDRDLFRMPQRVISSGCVRVGEAPALAEWILRDKGWSTNKVLNAMNSGKTQTVPLNQSVPVEMTYYTAYADPSSGQVKFWKDVYGLDRELAQKLGI